MTLWLGNNACTVHRTITLARQYFFIPIERTEGLFFSFFFSLLLVCGSWPAFPPSAENTVSVRNKTNFQQYQFSHGSGLSLSMQEVTSCSFPAGSGLQASHNCMHCGYWNAASYGILYWRNCVLRRAFFFSRRIAAAAAFLYVGKRGTHAKRNLL